MEKLTWFKFTISDWMMGKIMKCPEITQARFIRLCCLYWNKECVLSVEDAEIEIDEDHIKILLSKKIIVKNEDFITIKFLDEQNISVTETSNKRREAVKKRWDRVKQTDTSVSITDTSVIQNDTEKNREEKRRVDIKINSIVDRKLKFSQSLKPFLDMYGKDVLNEFYVYWSEPNKSNTKFKQELEKTWDLKGRLARWAKSDFNKTKPSVAKGVTDQSQNKNLFA